MDKEYISVHFHVVVSPDFELKLPEDFVAIRFRPEELGGFQQSKWKMEIERFAYCLLWLSH